MYAAVVKEEMEANGIVELKIEEEKMGGGTLQRYLCCANFCNIKAIATTGQGSGQRGRNYKLSDKG